MLSTPGTERPIATRAAQGRRNYLPTLDGWRAVAIVGVMLAHNQYRFPPGMRNVLFVYGDRGVQLFFALSGLLICSRLLSEEAESGTISLKGFYTRRLFRIQPAALTYLAVVALLTLLKVIPPFWPGMAAALFMVRNIWPAPTGYQHWFTDHFSSLSVEEHFYLILPGLLVLIRRYRAVVLCSIAALLEVWRVVVIHVHALQGFGWLLSFRTDMALGGIFLASTVAAALTHARIRKLFERYLQVWTALAFTAAVFLWLQVRETYINHILLIAVFPVLIVATMLHPCTVLGRLLEWAPVRFVGRLSYSLYLWQQMFFIMNKQPEPGSFRSSGLLCLAATCCCALVSYYLIETRMIRLGHRVAMRYTRAASERERPEPAAA